MTSRSAVWGVLRRLWSVAGVRPWHIAVPVMLLLVQAALEGGAYSLLVPLADAMSENSFDFLESSRWFGWVPALLPESLASSPGRDGYLAVLLVVLVIAGRASAVLVSSARRVYLNARNERFNTRVREATFERVLGFGRQYFDRQSLGRVDLEITWSTAAVRVLVGVEDVFKTLLGAGVKAAVMLVLSLPLTVAMVIVFPLLQLALARLSRGIERLARKSAEVEGRLRGQVLDLLATIPLVKAMSQERRAAREYGALLQEAEGLAVRRGMLVALRWPIEEILLLLTALVAQLVIVAFTADFRPGDLGRLAAFLLLLQQAMPQLKALGESLTSFAEQAPLLERVGRLFDDGGKYLVPSGDREWKGMESGIEVRGLTFSYGGGPPVLRDIDAVIPAGRVTAIVGTSGSGKSTFVDVVARFYDCPPATVFVDGEDVRDFSLPSLYRRVAIVSQDVWLLNRTLRENLVFGLDSAPPDEELIALLTELRFDDLLKESASLLDVELGDRGVQLSGGQRQRIAIARALLRRPDVLILDEATSALDSVVEQEVEAAIERRTRGRTLVVIAHRLSTIRHADQILVFEEGRVVERGTWDELTGAGGAFARLQGAQFGPEPVTIR